MLCCSCTALLTACMFPRRLLCDVAPCSQLSFTWGAQRCAAAAAMGPSVFLSSCFRCCRKLKRKAAFKAAALCWCHSGCLRSVYGHQAQLSCQSLANSVGSCCRQAAVQLFTCERAPRIMAVHIFMLRVRPKGLLVRLPPSASSTLTSVQSHM